MAIPDYIPFTSDEYQPDAPATALHFSRWFQNWEAGFGGAAGAPRLQAAAHPAFAAGDVVLLNVLGDGAEVLISTAVPQQVFGFHPVVSGQWRVRVEMIRDAIGVNVLTRVLKNGATVATLTQTGSAWAEFSADVSAAPGDFVSIVVLNSSSGSANRYRNIRICADQRGVFRL